MPKTPIKESELTDDKLHPARGKYAVAELIVGHEQARCITVPKGTRGILTNKGADGKYVFLFPHTVLRQKPKLFRDGDLRVVPPDRYKIIGRIDHA